jgi:hypothetical protein
MPAEAPEPRHHQEARRSACPAQPATPNGAFALGQVVFFKPAAVQTDGERVADVAGIPGAGLGLAVASLIAMPLLGVAKRRTGRRLDSPTLVADSAETLLCAYLSAILLAGLFLNATLGWSWADPIAAIGIAGLAVREGREKGVPGRG